MFSLSKLRDESFITGGGGGTVIFKGVGICFGDVGGGENKKPFGQRGGGVIYFIRYFVGSDVFHWFLLSKSQSPAKTQISLGTRPVLIRVFAVHMKKAWVLSYPLSAQRRLWYIGHFVGFVMRWLISTF